MTKLRSKEIRPVVVFDLGGVVIPECSEIIEACVAKFLGCSTEILHQINNERLPLASIGKITLLDIYRHVVTTLKKDMSPREVLDVHIREYIQTSTERDEHVLEVIQKLRKTHYVACLTNSEKEITELNKRMGLFDFFDRAFISTELEMRKPFPEIYEVVERTFMRDCAELVLIDDKEENVEAAAMRGWLTIQFKSSEQLESDLKEILRVTNLRKPHGKGEGSHSNNKF